MTSQMSDKETEELDDSFVDEIPNSSEEEDYDTKQEARRKKSRTPLYIATCVSVIAILVAGIWWVYKRQFVSTDDARIDGNITVVSSNVSARVKKIYVKDNQFVKKGDLLVELDSGDFEVALKQAQANLRTAFAKNKTALAEADYTRKIGDAAIAQANSGVRTARTTIESSRAETTLRSDLSRKARGAIGTAQANVRQAEAQIPIINAGIAQARSQVEAARSAYDAALVEFNRDQELVNAGYVSRQKGEQSKNEMIAARSNYESALKEVEIARGRLVAARRQVDAEKSRLNQANADASAANSELRKSLVDVDLSRSRANESTGKLIEAQSLPNLMAVERGSVDEAFAEIEKAQADVEKAELNLSYTKIYAPQDGYVAKRNIADGQLVQPGVSMMSITLPGIWVVGNFKETDLRKIKVGATVDIDVDAYPNTSFRGRVESIQPGTGSRFSVIPSDSASGNYIKVVQRIPVRIVFENLPRDDRFILVPGMSVEPHVRAQ